MSPSPPLRGEREGPDPQGWEGEVGDVADRLAGPPHPALSPRPASGEGKQSVARYFHHISLGLSDAEIGVLDELARQQFGGGAGGADAAGF